MGAETMGVPLATPCSPCVRVARRAQRRSPFHAVGGAAAHINILLGACAACCKDKKTCERSRPCACCSHKGIVCTQDGSSAAINAVKRSCDKCKKDKKTCVPFNSKTCDRCHRIGHACVARELESSEGDAPPVERPVPAPSVASMPRAVAVPLALAPRMPFAVAVPLPVAAAELSRSLCL